MKVIILKFKAIVPKR